MRNELFVVEASQIVFFWYGCPNRDRSKDRPWSRALTTMGLHGPPPHYAQLQGLQAEPSCHPSMVVFIWANSYRDCSEESENVRSEHRPIIHTDVGGLQ